MSQQHHQRIDEDDPRRCQGIRVGGYQCQNKVVEGYDYCMDCAPTIKTDLEDKKRVWLREQFEQRVKLDIDPGEEIKLLRENLTTINALIAANVALVKDTSSLLAYSGAISILLSKAERITHSLVKLEREANLLLAKPALIRWGQRIVQAVSSQIEGRFDGWEDVLLALSEDIGNIIIEASNEEEDCE